MSLCINPNCSRPNHSDNANNRFCQNCGSQLLLENRYRVMRLLSDNSGFGKIYEAYENGTPKILKVLKEHLNNHAKAVELFQQEAAVLAKLHHPGIPKVDGYFQYLTKNNLRLHCLVMEKIDGVNLEQWLQQHSNHPLNEQQALAWLKQLTEILQIVHDKQWFHRDIKPANIMVKNNGQLVLIDFGTARDGTYTYLSKLGAGQQITAVVSAGYTSPEQINSQAVPQSDFFALGRTFVHLLTGQHPLKFYDGQNDVLRWRQAVTISPLLGNLIDSLMARKPGERPLNTQALLQKIREIEQKTFPPSKKKLPLAVSVAALLLLGGGVGYLASKIGQTSLPSVSIPSLTGTNQDSLKNLSLVQILTGHRDGICIDRCIAISPDNSTLISGSYDGTIKIWNLTDGKEIRTLIGHANPVYTIALSKDGKTLISGSVDRTIKIWNLTDGREIRTLTGHENSVNSLAISPDGKTLISGSWDRTIKIWNLANGNLINTLTGHNNSVTSLALSKDGQTLVSGSADKTIKIWNLTDNKEIRTLNGHSQSVLSVTISPDEKTLVSGADDKTIKIWNFTNGNLINTLPNHDNVVTSVVISPDGQTLISSSADRTIKIWNLADGKEINTLPSDPDSITSLALSKDGQTLVSGGRDRTLKIWRALRES